MRPSWIYSAEENLELAHGTETTITNYIADVSTFIDENKSFLVWYPYEEHLQIPVWQYLSPNKTGSNSQKIISSVENFYGKTSASE